MQSKGIGISATSTQSQLAPRALHRELRIGAGAPKEWPLCPLGAGRQCPPGDPLTGLKEELSH